MLCLELQSYDKLNAARMKTPGAEKVSRAVTFEDYSVGQKLARKRLDRNSRQGTYYGPVPAGKPRGCKSTPTLSLSQHGARAELSQKENTYGM